MHQTHCKSKTPVPPPPSSPEPDDSADTVIQDQVSGGRHHPSPLPAETPTRLRAHIKPTICNTGLVQQAEYHRAHLADSLALESNLQPPSDTNALVNIQHVPPFSSMDSNIDPIHLAESQMPAHPLSGIMPHFLTPSPILGGNAMEEHVSEVRAPPAAQLNIPVTHIIPLTPIDATSFLVDADDSADAGTLLPGRSEPSTPTAGCRTAAINSILNEGYNDLEDILTQLINKTALSLQQIMDGWHKSKGQVINGINHWNLYTKYFAKHEDQKWQRLGLPTDVPGKLIHVVL